MSIRTNYIVLLAIPLLLIIVELFSSQFIECNPMQFGCTHDILVPRILYETGQSKSSYLLYMKHFVVHAHDTLARRDPSLSDYHNNKTVITQRCSPRSTDQNHMCGHTRFYYSHMWFSTRYSSRGYWMC